MCSRDKLFWINGFVLTYDPRPQYGFYQFNDGYRIDYEQTFSDSMEVPFITFPVQEEAFNLIEECMGRTDIGAEKSRDMGMTWIYLLSILHKWCFRNRQSFMVGSRTGDLVDVAGGEEGDTDTLFWKFDFTLEHLPGWLTPRFVRSKMRLYNRDTKSLVNGATSTGNLARGGRRTCLFLDELAAWELKDGYEALSSTQAASPCRMFGSTPKGVGNAFADQMLHTEIRKFRLHWSEHPTKRRGLYTSKDGVLKILDEDYDFQQGYRFIMDGRVRSPFYDAECARSPLDTLVKQEQDIDYLGSGSQFFSIPCLKRHIETHTQDPWERGEIVVGDDPRDSSWLQSTGGLFWLWCALNMVNGKARPQRDRQYVIGADVSSGTGASNSAAAIGDLRTREKVGIFANPNLRPEEFALICAAIGYWFCDADDHPAQIIWESNGPGRQFGAKLVDLGYPAMYFREKEDELGRPVERRAIPGWWAQKEAKRVMLGDLNEAYQRNLIVDRCKHTLREAETYVFNQDGTISSSKARNPLDPSGANANHGDRVTATGLMWKLMKDGVVRKDNKTDSLRDAPPGSLAQRRYRRAMENRQREEELCAW